MTEHTDVRKVVIAWLLSQGVSTVILCGILVFLGYLVLFSIPSHIKQIQQGYISQAKLYGDSLKLILDSHKNDREAFERILDRNSHESKANC